MGGSTGVGAEPVGDVDHARAPRQRDDEFETGRPHGQQLLHPQVGEENRQLLL